MKSIDLRDTHVLSQRLAQTLDAAIVVLAEEARQRQQPPPQSLDDVQFDLWTQTWPTTACGFPGESEPVYTTAITIGVACDFLGLVAVYHNHRFAYLAVRTTYYEQARRRSLLPGVTDERLDQLSDTFPLVNRGA